MKTQNLKLTLAALVALVAAASLGHAARAATLTVTSLADSGFGTLRQRIAAAANGDTINFKVTGIITLTSGQLTVNKKLNIIGPPPNKSGINGVTVSGNDQSRVFDITSTGDVTISNLNIAHGHANVGFPRDPLVKKGGGIRNLGNLHLVDCSIHHNKAEIEPRENSSTSGAAIGAGIFNLADLLVEHCVIAHNSVGTLFPYAGGRGIGVANAGRLKLDSSTIAYNDPGAIDVGGGGLSHADVVSFSTPQQLEIVNCNFYANRATSGGALLIVSTHDLQVPLIEGTTFAGNIARFPSGYPVYIQGYGGAILAGSSLTIKNSTISGNRALTTGGGIVIFYGQITATLNNVTIFGNSLESDNDHHIPSLGCGIRIINYEAAGTTVLNMANSIVSGNFNSINPSHSDDMNGQVVSFGNNLIQDTTGATITGDQTGNIYGLSPDLLTLADNGGPTLTHALLSNSWPVDHGGDSTSEPTDQRGVIRPFGPHPDIGAYEGAVAALPKRVDLSYNPAPYLIVCDPAGPFPPWQGSILGSREFDVRAINIKSLRLQTRTAGPLSLAYRDVNDDGIVDLVVSFDLNQALQGQVCEAVTQLDLTGQTLSDEPIFGAVQVEAVAR